MPIDFFRIERFFQSQAFLEDHNPAKKKVKKFIGKLTGKPFTLSKKPVIRRTTNK